MNISEKGLQMIKGFEGCVLYSYDDATGKVVRANDNVIGTLTIGYGHTLSVKKGQTITQARAEELLRNDIVVYSTHVQVLINNGTIMFKVNQNMFDALTSFCYNLGNGNLTRLVQGRVISEVASKMLLYVQANGKVLQGLINRRNKERELFLTPVVVEYAKPKYNQYVVAPGDNLTNISKKLKVTISKLAELNKIKDLNKIYVGQVLQYQDFKIVDEFIVKKGDNLTKISKLLNVSIEHLANTNNIQDINKIYVGQVLKY